MDRLREEKTSYTYDDYDHLSSVMLPRDHLFRKSTKTEPARPVSLFDQAMDRKMWKCRSSLEPILEQSNDFSIQELGKSALKSIPDDSSHKSQSVAAGSPNKSVHLWAGSGNPSPFAIKGIKRTESKSKNEDLSVDVP